MPGFLARLTRPFTSASFLGVATENGVGATSAHIPEGAQKATIAAGCFWGVEHIYRKHFADKGLYDARVGYIGGDTKSPSYRAVCTGETGHAEATQLIYDPTKITYAQLLEFFYRMHDPTTKNRQGNDRGTQYRSGIFYHDAEQKRVAEEITAKVNEQWYSGKVATEVIEAGQWWDAEDYHQLYLDKNPSGYQCASHYVREFPSLK
ncbi:PMSR-domain-containing protein [Cryphonectria parasitica EP155]|uniref:peptide-methionine (S)-S-oxide reductase n=1 Tax=Cryphonectria parasitica (strain ATCC 38755 / EP155) TaxID=660469 RepID=A0A9P4Y126_CRYP1|nr:PMSR-domain-containing protein [Cryphonectria parasitica EP155]KAF3764427.1 PMSR-domain-containing protein [Cryphonectria parasitica EP155]